LEQAQAVLEQARAVLGQAREVLERARGVLGRVPVVLGQARVGQEREQAVRVREPEAPDGPAVRGRTPSELAAAESRRSP
jgi:hypothetical protein